MKHILAAALFVLATSAFAETAPTEFVTQILEPTGGKISRPKDWFYVEAHHGPVYDWMLTREDTDGGKKSYTTGVRIQTFTGVKQGTGKSAKQFILDFLTTKKKKQQRSSRAASLRNNTFSRVSAWRPRRDRITSFTRFSGAPTTLMLQS